MVSFSGRRLIFEIERKDCNQLESIGKIFGVEPGTIAVAWLLAHPANILPVLGTNSLARIETISKAIEVKLDRQTWFEIYTAALGREIA